MECGREATFPESGRESFQLPAGLLLDNAFDFYDEPFTKARSVSVMYSF